VNTVIDRNRMHVQDDSPHDGLLPEFETERQEAAEDYAAVRTHVTNVVQVSTGATQFGTYETIIIPASTATVPAQARVLPRDDLRQYAYITAVDFPVVLATTLEQAQAASNVTQVAQPVPSQPGVPATTVAVQNTSAYPVSVVISAGTLTAVIVNGITVGTGDGTYIVPSAGAISITYSVAPTWVWSNANAGPASVATIPNGAYLPAGSTTPPIRHNDPVYVANTSITSPCRVTIYVERGNSR